MDAEDSLKVKADRMTGVSVGMMPPRLSGSRLGSAAAPQPGREQEGCWWKCSSSLGLALWLQQVKWSEWGFVRSLEPCCLICGSLVLPLLCIHISYSDPDVISPYQGCKLLLFARQSTYFFLLISSFSQVETGLNVNYLP